MKGNMADEAVYLNGELNKDRLLSLAKAFDELAVSFLSLPKEQDKLSKRELNNIFESLGEKFCKKCPRCKICWEENYYETYQAAFEILSQIEEGGDNAFHQLEGGFTEECIEGQKFPEEIQLLFHKELSKLKWNNKIISAREAVSEQLKAMSQIILQLKDEVCLVEGLNPFDEKNIRYTLKSNRIAVKNIFFINKPEQRKELRLTIRTQNGRCISTREIAALISSLGDINYSISKNCKNVIGADWYPVTLVEEVNFKVLHGIARKIKDNERVSGDNFSVMEYKEGKSLLCLADGMGSGLNACMESENVIELIEELTEAGFRKEAAVKMINSLSVVKADEPLFTTVDLCEIDLYNGLCEFVKVGASSSFIKRKNWVEVIESASLPIGLIYGIDTEGVSKKLYDGDFIIMVTDGVLDAFAPVQGEEMIRDIIEEIDSNNPTEFAGCILERVLEYNNGSAGDDMTILVAGIWGK